MSIRHTKLAVVSQVEALAASIANLSHADPMVLGGKKIAKADVIVVLRAFLDAAAAREAAHVEWKKALSDERKALDEMLSLRELLKSYLESRHGKRSPELVTYGFAPAKSPKLTVEGKHAGVVKRRATRKAETPSAAPVSANGATAPVAPTGHA